MTHKTPTLAVKNDSIAITIVQDTVSIQPVYNVTVEKAHHTDKLRNLSLADLQVLVQALDVYSSLTTPDL